MSQQPGGYNPGQQGGQGNQGYNSPMMPRMGQPMNYSPNVQYPPMMGQPGPQMGGIGTPGQPRSPMVHSLQAQGPTTGQPSPLAGGPHSHMGPGSIGPPGGPHSTGPLSVHGAPHSTGPSSVFGGPQSTGGPSSVLTQSLGPGSVLGPSSVLGGSQSTGGPGSVLGASTGPLSNLAPHSVGGPLSVHGGPASTGDFLGNPQSLQMHQPLSVPRVVEDPRSVGPHSVNQPVTPMNPASAQMLSSHTPATPGQPLKQDTPEPFVLLPTDPMTHTRDLVLKDLRYSIVRHNASFAECMREARGESIKSPGQPKEECLQAHDTLLSVMDEVENSLTVVIEAPKQAARLDKSSESKDKYDGAIQQIIMSRAKTQELLKNAVADVLLTRNKLRARQDKFLLEQSDAMEY